MDTVIDLKGSSSKVSSVGEGATPGLMAVSTKARILIKAGNYTQLQVANATDMASGGG
jgi:hypothetical protein